MAKTANGQARPSAKTLEARLADTAAIDAALKRGVREALLRHKRLGHSVVVFQNGQPVWLTPDQITIDDEPGNGKHE